VSTAERIGAPTTARQRQERQRREQQRRELRLMERAGLVDTLPIRPAIEARRWLHCGIEKLTALGLEENKGRPRNAARGRPFRDQNTNGRPDHCTSTHLTLSPASL
jgi:hypothetical protein